VAFKLKLVGLRFDSKAVEDAVDEATRKNLSAGGALTRKIQQQSMRYGDRPSRPGSPPTAHRGGRGPLLRKFVGFGFDPSTRSVVVGPAQLGSGQAPEVQEHGGTVRARRRVYAGGRRGRKATGAQAAGLAKAKAAGRLEKERYVEVFVPVAARPSADPALDKAKPKLAGVWADSVKP
jgi:hypothetical protein